VLSRSQLKDQESKIKNADSFVDGAEQTPAKRVGRPKSKAEKSLPIAISLTKTETGYLDSIHKRLNAISYANGDELNLDRSNLIRQIAVKARELSDHELYEWFKSLDK